MAFTKMSTIFFVLGFLLQSTLSLAKADCGYAPPVPFCGGYPYGCPVPAPVAPPITFAPVPQPVPVRVPVPRPQSVTIPNIILALLPPTPKSPVVRPCLPPPIPRPQPIVVPLPRPYPVPVPDYGCASPPCGC